MSRNAPFANWANFCIRIYVCRLRFKCPKWNLCLE